ncbi:efflux RND transporter periplasmic adaptor subunit [Methylocella silvestris]|uniref:Efflux transporter periplasmic adaptor subunit n=1 Tax=Methylocella silvestris TaxID=199596 RepID=A0A2J7TKN0_METSI|nr:efflux RND transporter periplasmic adaptor subunit [Methylocella silvestris]PNG27331.1 efflux transporter periplasmic adaptor subunit [Methylocella silvestris]
MTRSAVRRAQTSRGNVGAIKKRQARRGAIMLAAVVLAGPLRAEPADRAMTVSVVRTKTQCFVDSLRLNGRIVARDETLVRPDVEGLQIVQVLVEDGASVTAGQPLAQLARPDWLPGLPTKATMTASASGLVVYGRLPVGMPASARGEPMFRIIRDGQLELLVDLPLPALARIKPGQIAQMETLDESEFAGAVRLILPDVDPLTQQGRALIQLGSSAGLKPGAFATATIDAGQSCGPAAPLSSILYGPEGAIVQVVRDNRVETRRVKVGLFGGFEAEIREGLAPGDVVVARAGAFLREGDIVRTVP